MLTLAIFVSGRGSNFRAVQSAIDEGRLDARTALVVTSREDAAALEFARSRAIPVHLARGAGASGDALVQVLSVHGVDFIVLCGYLKLVPAEVVRTWRDRMLNIHPALLPAFGGHGMYGHHVHEAVIASGARVSGATVHLVSEEYDRGPIVLQRTVEVRDDDTPDALAARVLTLEHALLPEAVQLFARNRIRVSGLRTIHLPNHS
jgi:formyltetrahydrofolate-dependent phosphoribosylglycinamide formyltransferase